MGVMLTPLMFNVQIKNLSHFVCEKGFIYLNINFLHTKLTSFYFCSRIMAFSILIIDVILFLVFAAAKVKHFFYSTIKNCNFFDKKSVRFLKT
jgi:hypothetical protein